MWIPPLSSVDIDIQRIGYKAARMLHRRLMGAKFPAKAILVAPRRVVVRQSSNVVAVEDPDIAAAMRFIRDHAGEPLSVKDILREVPISRKVLERHFEKLVGRTPKAEILRVRLDRAKMLLSETDLPMPEVAQRSGFANNEMLPRYFRKKIGMTPTQYRHSCRPERNVQRFETQGRK